MTRLFLLFASLFIGYFAQAQNEFSTNFHTKIPYLANPAAAGALDAQAITINARGQFFQQNNPTYANVFGAFEKYVDKWNSGFGIRYTSSKAGEYIARFDYALSYNYRIDLKENVFLNIGIEGAYAQENIDYANSIGGTGVPKATAFDTSAGLLLKANDFLMNVSVQHLNKPAFDHYPHFTAEAPRIPRFLVVTAQYDIAISEKITLTPSGLLAATDEPIFMSIGASIDYDKKAFAGLQFRPTADLFPMSFQVGATLFEKATLAFAYEPAEFFGPTMETLLRVAF